MSKLLEQSAGAPAHALDPNIHKGCYIYSKGKKRTVKQILMELKEFFPDTMSWPALEIMPPDATITWNQKFETVCSLHGTMFKPPNALFSLRNGGCRDCAKERGLQIFLKADQHQPRQYVEPSTNMRVTNLTNRGFVYIISNRIFKDVNIRKIGLTQGHDPQTRIDTLHGSSIPYPFDINAIVYSEQAAQLEHHLHTKFSDRRLANNREFFDVPLTDIEQEIKAFDTTAQYFINADSKAFKQLVKEHSKMLSEEAKNVK